MKITEALFAGSSTRISEKPKQKFPEFAFIGRSNVGKSSLINMLCRNKKLAMTSSKPGKTRLVNHFLINREWYLVDLPGYGYAKVSKEEKEKWGKLMDEFLTTQPLKLIVSLVDIRHDPTSDDKMMINYLYSYAVPFALVATKADKLGKTKIKPALKDITVSVSNSLP